MTFEEYWSALEEKNTAFKGAAEDVVKLRLRGLKALVQQAYDKGVEQASEAHKGVDKLNKAYNAGSSSMPDFMGSFFSALKK